MDEVREASMTWLAEAREQVRAVHTVANNPKVVSVSNLVHSESKLSPDSESLSDHTSRIATTAGAYLEFAVLAAAAFSCNN